MKNRITKLVKKICIVLITLTSVNLYAAAKTWTGAISTEWNETNNWFEAGVPGSGDDVTIPTSPTGGRMPIISSATFGTKKLTIQSGATLTQNGGTLTPTDNISITGSFIQTTGTFSTTKDLTVNAGGTVSFGGSFSGANVEVKSTGAVSVSGTFTTNENKITIDGGTFTQTGGTVSTKNMELKNSGTYNQSNGEFQISQDLKVPSGNIFNGTGGTVHFTGAAGGGADYTGNVQFNNVLIDAGADYNMDNNSDVIKISGNYTNNNSSLDNDKGTLNFNGTSPQTIYSASTPASSRTIAANVIVSNPSVTLLSNIGIHSSLSFNSGGQIDKNGFDIYLAGVLYNGPTPVELVSFNAKVRNNVVLLDWKTATEVNNYGFEIERSQTSNVKGQNWEKIGFVNGHGNSNSPKEYSFEDSKLSNNSYQYRLKQVDNDGSFAYSNIVSVSIDQVPNNFALIPKLS